MKTLETSGLILISIFVAVSSVTADSASSQCEVRLRTDAGWVCGRIRTAENITKYASFRGVPYAKPPIGERRFKELEPVDPWDGTLDGTEDGPACPQKNLLYGSITLQPKGMSEDCIQLNLHVPYDNLPQETASVQTKPLPILVMIHGGGFNSGSGLTDLHGPEYLIVKGVIVISFNYRLNVIGYLSLGSKEIPGNQALRDMVTLLKWVQRNARAFGGDPNNVTLIGQSAGATSVHLLSMSKAAEGLFHRIILMSGSAVPDYFTTSPLYAKRVADLFLHHLNINSTNPEEIHKQLVETPIVNIMHANAIVQHAYGVVSFVPVAEEEYPGITRIVEDDPLKLIAEGRGTNYPAIIGFTDKEEESFRYPMIITDALHKIEANPMFLLPVRFLYNLPMEDLKKLGDEIFQKCFNGDPNLNSLLVCTGYTNFKYPAIKLAEWRGVKGAPTYLYQYSYRSERNLVKEAIWTPYEGAAHVEDLTYVFRVNSMLNENDVSIPPKNNDDRMIDWMTTLVTNFMRCSNPTCSDVDTQWPSVTPKGIQYQNIAEPMVFKMMNLSDQEKDMIQFLEHIDEEARNITLILKNS